jgi:hypothetical protein
MAAHGVRVFILIHGYSISKMTLKRPSMVAHSQHLLKLHTMMTRAIVRESIKIGDRKKIQHQ